MSAAAPGLGADAAVWVVLGLLGILLLALLVRGLRRAGRVIDRMPLPPARPHLRAVCEPSPDARSCLDLARSGRAEQLRERVTHGRLSPNLVDADGVTPLMVAAAHGRRDVLEVLLDLGADVNRLSSAGLSALAFALLHGECRAINLLLSHGASPDHGSPSAREIAEETGRAHLLDVAS